MRTSRDATRARVAAPSVRAGASSGAARALPPRPDVSRPIAAGVALALTLAVGGVRAQALPVETGLDRRHLPAADIASPESDPPVPGPPGCEPSDEDVAGEGTRAIDEVATANGTRAADETRATDEGAAGDGTRTVGPNPSEGDADTSTGGALADAGSCGDPPGAVRVALVDAGVNYTLPTIARALAREPDGTLVGRDFWDLDPRPFDRHPARGGRLARHGTRTASVLIDEAPGARLVPYRYPRPDMSRMRDLVAHAAAADVRVVGLPLGGNRREEWTAFEAAAREHPSILFVASAGNDGRDIDERPVWPAALALDNLVTVTSSDDFGRLAAGVNRGRRSVDYLVPAEHVAVTRFDGSRGRASGSSYAVPRTVALAARLLAERPGWGAPELVAEFRRRFADGSHPRAVAEGRIIDPLAVGERSARVVAERSWSAPRSAPHAASRADARIDPRADPRAALAPDASGRTGGAPSGDDERANGAPEVATNDGSGAAGSVGSPSRTRPVLAVPLDALVPDDAWNAARVDVTLARAASILDVCALRLAPVRVREVDAPARLADLSTGGARTLFEAVRASGAERRATVVFARDTRMSDPYDGEAFGRGNTADRPWLADSVWLTARIDDAGIALAHELVHVLVNSGEHHPETTNLMHARTSGDNVALEPAQCERLRRTALASGLATEP